MYGFAGPGLITEDTLLSEDYTEYGRGKVACERQQLHAQTWQFSEARLARHLRTLPRRSFHDTVRDTAMYR